ncbi:MAG TPA: VOC family protein [Rudaea sp.]
MLNPVNVHWFEIPVRNLDRAQRFYEESLGVTLKRERFEDSDMAEFPHDADVHATGALVRHAHVEPTNHGSVIYLNVDDVETVLARFWDNGAEVLLPRTELPAGIGVIAQIRDCEGNRVGLWSPC